MAPIDAIYLFFNVNICSHHFVAPHHPPPFTPVEVLVVLAMPIKRSKMMCNSASYPFNSWCIERLWIAIELWWIACKHLFFHSQGTIFQIIKIGISEFYNCAKKPAFHKSGHIFRDRSDEPWIDRLQLFTTFQVDVISNEGPLKSKYQIILLKSKYHKVYLHTMYVASITSVSNGDFQKGVSLYA